MARNLRVYLELLHEEAERGVGEGGMGWKTQKGWVFKWGKGAALVYTHSPPALCLQLAFTKEMHVGLDKREEEPQKRYKILFWRACIANPGRRFPTIPVEILLVRL